MHSIGFFFIMFSSATGTEIKHHAGKPIMLVFGNKFLNGEMVPAKLELTYSEILENRIEEWGYSAIYEAHLSASRGCYEQDCRVETGKMVGAEIVLTLTLSQISSVCRIDAAFYSITSSVSRNTTTGEVSCDLEPLSYMLESVLQRLTASIEAARRLNVGEEEEEGGMLIVTGDPISASVYVNDRLIGVTPVKKQLPAGDYRVRVAARCYIERQESVQIEVNKVKRFHASLSPLEQLVSIVSEDQNGAPVADAWFFADEVPVGRTPGTFKISRCSRLFRVEDHENGCWLQRIEDSDKVPMELVARLNPDLNAESYLGKSCDLYSKEASTWLSLGTTLGSFAVGGALVYWGVEKNGGEALIVSGVTVMSTGFLFGPSAGYFYTGEVGAGFGYIGWRTLFIIGGAILEGAAVFAGGLRIPVSSTSGSKALAMSLGVGGLVVGAGSIVMAIYNIIDASNAAGRSNHSILMKPTIAPHIIPVRNGEAYGVAVEARF